MNNVKPLLDECFDVSNSFEGQTNKLKRMKILISVAKIITILLLILDLLFGLMAHASGHKIPSETDWTVGISSLILLGIFFLLNFISKKNKH